MRKIELKVITKAKKEGIKRMSGNSYIVKVSPPPEKGKANKRVTELVSKEFGVKKREVRILSGEKSHRKILAIGT